MWNNLYLYKQCRNRTSLFCYLMDALNAFFISWFYFYIFHLNKDWFRWQGCLMYKLRHIILQGAIPECDFVICFIRRLETRECFPFLNARSHLLRSKYNKQDQLWKAAFNERSAHMTKQQEPVARSPGGPQT
jgi:hypothetical protein